MTFSANYITKNALTSNRMTGVGNAPPDDVFTLASIENLFAWYDYTKADTITKDGSDLMTEWADYSGNGNNLASATTRRPTYTADGVLFNGSQFMYADNASDWTFLHDGTGCTVFVVLKTNSPDPNASMAMIGTSNTSSIGIIYVLEDSLRNDGARMFNYNGSSLVFNVFNSDIMTQEQTTVMSHLFGIEEGLANDLKLYSNAYNYRSNDVFNTPSSSPPSYPMYLGSTGSGNAYYFEGLIKEVGIYNRKITSEEHTLALNYLIGKHS